MKIIFTGGGTGGHVFPIIAVCREIRKLRPDLQLYYVGPEDEWSAFFLSQEGIKVKTVLAGKVRRYRSFNSFFQNLIDVLIRIPIGFLQSFFYIFFLFPDLIFSKGGYGAFPTSLAGRVLNTPVILHESDAVPGLANRLIGKFAIEIFTSFPTKKTRYFPQQKTISVGNPIRKEILRGDIEEAKKLFELTKQKPLILILGGSQGAQRINDLILNILPPLLENFEVVHQVGFKNLETMEQEAKIMVQNPHKKGYRIFPFFNETGLKHALRACDFVVSRAGAGSIFEIAGNKKPSILIPLPESAQNHQIKNAYAYQDSGACQVLEEENLAPHFFLEKLKHLLSSPDKLKEMSLGAEKFSRPRAGEVIAKYIVEYLIL